jgi:hypothetical protein
VAAPVGDVPRAYWRQLVSDYSPSVELRSQMSSRGLLLTRGHVSRGFVGVKGGLGIRCEWHPRVWIFRMASRPSAKRPRVGLSDPRR